HCNRLRRVTSRRTSVRPMASTISDAWCASRTISRANCEAASAASLPRARRWLRALMPARRGTIAASTGSRVGSAIVDTTKAVQMRAASRGSNVISRRKLLNDLDVGNQTGARKYSFEEVVAEQRVLRYTAGERGVEGVDVIDALAGIRALIEEILVDVGHCG